MTTRGSLARGQGQQPQQFQGHVQRWTKQWVPAGGMKGTSIINLLKWVPTGDRSETPAGPRVPHLIPVKDPDVKARLLGQRAPPDAVTATSLEAAQAAFQAPADVGKEPEAQANGDAIRQLAASSAAVDDAAHGVQPTQDGVRGEQRGPAACEQVHPGLLGEGRELSAADGAPMQIDQQTAEAAEDCELSAAEGAPMQVDQQIAGGSTSPRVSVADPAPLGPTLPIATGNNRETDTGPNNDMMLS